MVLTIGYWSIRGLGEPVHLVLEYLQLPYDRKTYYIENYLEWFAKDKVELGMDFPNLPYVIDGEFKVAQTLTVLKYIGRKHGLFGSDDVQELAKQEEILDNIHDFRIRFARLCYGEKFDSDRVSYFAPLPNEHLNNVFRLLANYESLLSKKKYLTGDNPFVGDFFLWHVLDIHECLEPNILESLPNLAKFKAAIASLPTIDNYLKSDKFKKFPINAPTAKWGGTTEG